MDPHDVLDDINDGKNIEPVEAPTAISVRDVLDKQRFTPFCTEILSGNGRANGQFIESEDGVLRRISAGEVNALHIFLPKALRPWILKLAHNAKLARYSEQSCMCDRLKKRFYWPQMAADVANTVRIGATCSHNRLKLRKRTNPLRLFPAGKPLVSVVRASWDPSYNREPIGDSSLL